ncbi:ZIP family metal transporter [Candidatus Peregrinibacteria bacterium]|jgi:zinc and cadmium transporter|nr:ZIP family metal transporter [Candidatus Peregrinibacteria bacterium]MBT7736774.1 ZIP family metal transporter [Candidatus Peregrinibacteria bacterium]
MIETWVYALVSVLVISTISLVGVFTLGLKEDFLKKILIYLVSFSAGALLGGAFLHLIPEAVHEHGFHIETSLLILGGVAVSFVMEKIVCWRHCHHPTTNDHPHPFAWMNLVGDAIHNFMDGLIIGAAYLVSIPVGLAATMAVALHEIPQEIGDFGVLIHGGFSKGKALALNFLVSLSAILGVVIALMMGAYAKEVTHMIVPFAAGTFIYIGGSDLIPELHKHQGFKKGVLQFITFVLGIGVMMLMLLLETGHAH